MGLMTILGGVGGRVHRNREERRSIREEVAALQPPHEPGDLKTTARPTPSEGWLFCDGTAISRTTYAALFAAIGTVYGSGDGTTTFNIPDFRGRAIVGAGNGGAGYTERFRGAMFGSEGVVLAVPNMPIHGHGGSVANALDHNHAGFTFENGGHNHGIYFGGANNTPTSGSADRLSNVGGPFASGFTDNAGNHGHAIPAGGAHGHSIPLQGSDTPHSNVQPSAVARVLIKT